MQNIKHSSKATNVTVQQAVVMCATGVAVSKVIANNTMVRLQQRIAQVQALRSAKNTARKQHAKQQAYMLQVQQLATQYGVEAPSFAPQVAANARANSATIAPSRELVSVAGVGYKPCKAVHALCATLPANATRKEQMQLCIDNGINRATASTQVGIYRKAANQAAE